MIVTIDTEVLKEQIKTTNFEFLENYDDEFDVIQRVCEVIDNAIADAERPTGEWIVIHNALGKTKYQCNQCQHFVNPGDDKNFCSNCETRMRKIT